MSEIGIGWDFSALTEALNTYFATPEGQATLVESGFVVPEIAAPAPAPAAPVAAPTATPVATVTVTAPLTKTERKEVFVEQRSAELEAAGKPVNTDALEKRFDELSKTTEGRAQITTVVQRAEPEILQAIVPDKVSVPAPAVAPIASAPAATPVKPISAASKTPVTAEPEPVARDYFDGNGDRQGSVIDENNNVVPATQVDLAPRFSFDPGSPEYDFYSKIGGTITGADQELLDERYNDFLSGKITLSEFKSFYGNDTGLETEDPVAEQMRLDREQREAQAEVDRVSKEKELAAAIKQKRENARQSMANVLSTYGLGDLADFVYNEIIVKEVVDINNPDAIIFAIREQPAYQKRFAGNAARLKKGLPELDPSSYISLENQFRQTLQSNGLPANFYDQTDDFQALIEGDVSPSELNERVQQGYRAVADADPMVKQQMKTLYGVGDGELAAYFLDPQRTAPLLTRQAQAANIAARGLEQGGMQLTGTFAEDLARRGITEQQARAGFAEVGALGELKQTFAGETALSGEQLAGAAFGIDVAAQQELERKRRQRVGEFAGGGSFARTTGETSGSISAGVGKAQ